jgi:iron-sulfur cluster repair protein YtfE (RIC family)
MHIDPTSKRRATRSDRARRVHASNVMDPTRARAVLLAQHDRLRRLLMVAQAVADRVLGGEGVVAELHPHLDALQAAFAEHNASEEELLEPILRLDFAWGPARIARMLEEHAAEHASFREAMSGPALEIAGRIAELIEDIDAHMAAEERTFLSPGVLRDDVVETDDGD